MARPRKVKEETPEVKAVQQPAKKGPRGRTKGEVPIKAESAKVLYVEMGRNRSLAKVATLLGKEQKYTRVLEGWSSKYSWVASAKEFDEQQMRELAASFRTEQEAKVDEMNALHADFAKKLHEKAVKRLTQLLDNDELWGRDAVALYKESISAERLARNQATERIEAKQDIDIDAKVIIETQWGTSKLGSEEEEAKKRKNEQ